MNCSYRTGYNNSYISTLNLLLLPLLPLITKQTNSNGCRRSQLSCLVESALHSFSNYNKVHSHIKMKSFFRWAALCSYPFCRLFTVLFPSRVKVTGKSKSNKEIQPGIVSLCVLLFFPLLIDLKLNSTWALFPLVRVNKAHVGVNNGYARFTKMQGHSVASAFVE